MIGVPMYGGPLDLPSVLAWILIPVVGALLALRAVRVEMRAGRAGDVPRTRPVRVLDGALDAVLAVATVGLVVALVSVVLVVFG